MAVSGSMDASDTNLRTCILNENTYIKNLIDTISPQYYFQSDMCEEIVSTQRERVNNLVKRLKRKKNKSMTNAYKRMKLNPDEHLTVTQIQRKLAETNQDESVIVYHKNTSEEMDRSALLKKLHSKVELLKGKRKNSPEWKLRRKEKRLLRKLKMKEKKNAQKTNVNKGLNTEKIVIKKEKEEEKKSKITKPYFNEGKNMVFSKFDFSETGVKEKKKKMPAGKDYKQLLERVEKVKSKVKELEDKDPEKACLMKEKESWLKVMQKAEGVKIKDNPELLKKALKKKELRMKKSKKNWESREAQVKEKMEKKQKKRKDNIKAKRDEKVKKKVKRAMKKGRYIPV